MIVIMLHLLIFNLNSFSLNSHTFTCKEVLRHFYFSVFSPEEDSASPSSPKPSPPSWTSTGSYHDNLMQLEPALKLLIQTMTDSSGDRQSVSFSKKLADITLNFLYCLLQDAVLLSEKAKLKGGKQVNYENFLISFLIYLSYGYKVYSLDIFIPPFFSIEPFKSSERHYM